MKLVDTHCHLHLFEPVPAVAPNTTVHVMTVNPDEFDAARDLFGIEAGDAKRTGAPANIQVALGLFPEPVAAQEAALPAFLERLPGTRFVGEIGLDYVTESEDERARQRRLLETILEACGPQHVLSLHSRRAAADTVAMLRGFSGTAILHWFSGPAAVVENADPALYWSLNTAMARSDRSKILIRRMNPERILTETDGPYITIGDRPAAPKDVRRVIDFLAREWDVDAEEAAARVWQNYQTVMGSNQ